MIKNSRGQIAVEFILITVLIVSVSLFVGNYLKRTEFMGNLTGGPWGLLTGMIENGVWDNPRVGKTLHPNYLYRSVSFKGDSD